MRWKRVGTGVEAGGVVVGRTKAASWGQMAKQREYTVCIEYWKQCSYGGDGMGFQLVAYKGRFVLCRGRASGKVLGYLFIHQTMYRGGCQRFK